MTIVYRVQDSDGRGPWKPGFSHRWVEPRDDHENLIPWAAEFGRVDRKALTWEHLGSGCLELTQLRRWFTQSEYKSLLHYGYRAVRMEVDRILGHSDKQCIFARLKPLKEDAIEVELY